VETTTDVNNAELSDENKMMNSKFQQNFEIARTNSDQLAITDSNNSTDHSDVASSEVSTQDKARPNSGRQKSSSSFYTSMLANM